MPDDGLEFLRNPVPEPVIPTLYVVAVLTVEERSFLRETLNSARVRLRDAVINRELTTKELTAFNAKIRELDRLSRSLLELPAFSSRKDALDHARDDV